MTNILLREDFGNSLKNKFLQDFTIQFVNGDVEILLNSETIYFHWKIVGAKKVQGKQAFAAELEQLRIDPVGELTREHVFTHSKAGAVTGTIKQTSGKTYAFCDVVEFNTAKAAQIKRITT